MILDFIVVGACGYMGSNALHKEALPALISTLRTNGIEARLHAVVDSQFDKPSIIARFTEWLDEQFGHSIERGMIFKTDFIEALLFINKGRKTIIYDAAPPNFRLQHAQLLVGCEFENVYFFGEKPFVLLKEFLANPGGGTKPLTTENLPERLVFCNFIETENEVFQQAKKYLDENNCTIRELWFWRAGASGLKHAIEAERSGVSGGALLDKAPHDLALTVALLDPDIEDFQVARATVERFALGQVPPKTLQHDSLLSWLRAHNSKCADEFSYDPDGRALTADAVTSLSIDWNVRTTPARRQVKAHYLVSWLGYTGARFGKRTATITEQRFIDILDDHGIFRENWLMQCPAGWGPVRDWGIPPINANYCTSHSLTYSDQVRMVVIRTDDRTLIGNFFRDNNNSQAPFLTVLKDGAASRIALSDTTEGAGFAIRKGKDMYNVFLRVVQHVMNGQPAPYISKSATLWVHRALFAVQAVALRAAQEEKRSPRAWHELSAPIYRWAWEEHKRARDWPPPEVWTRR